MTRKKISKGGFGIQDINIVNNNEFTYIINSPIYISFKRHIAFVLYLIFCVLAINYIKNEISIEYRELLFNFNYSTRNQKICGNNPIEYDTIRYTMNSTFNKPLALKLSSFDNLYYIIAAVGFVTLICIILYYFAGNAKENDFLKYFDDDNLFVTNIAIFIIVIGCIGFWVNYSKIKKIKDIETYDKHVKIVLANKELLPDPKDLKLEDLINPPAETENAQTTNTVSNLYNRLIKRIMYVDNLESYQDAINKWNKFTSNADIFPYLILSNSVTHNITPETIEAKKYFDLWNSELKSNKELAISTATPPVLEKTSTSLNKATITYINTNILPFLSKTDTSKLSLTVDGITSYFAVLIGTQNIDNDYSILFQQAQNMENNSELLNSLFWLSNLSNGDPSETFYSIMQQNTILYSVLNVISIYVPFHIFYKLFNPAVFTIFIIIAFIVAIILFQIYYYHKTKRSKNNVESS